MTFQERLYTTVQLREIENLPENHDKRFELLRGEIYEMAAPSATHPYISNKFGRFLDEYAEEHNSGYAFGDSCSYILSDHDELIPDASFISNQRHSSLPLPIRFNIAPDLAVEVVSPSNRPREMHNKVETYLQHGTKLVWVVYPIEKVIDVYRLADDGGLHVHKMEIDGILDGEDVLPGFTLAVKRVFPKE
jgi:Uma2 family endonuclease